MIAMIKAISPDNLPTVTKFFSEAFLFIMGLYMSNVNMVEVLLIIEASDETMAAERAARIIPFRPVGIKLEINHG